MERILDLTNPANEFQTLNYKILQFPDGQQNIVIGKNLEDWNPWTNAKISVEIRSRLNNFKDLELICCAVASLRQTGFKRISLFIPYLLGARSDRQFEDGGNAYLRQVIAPILNSLDLDRITCLDVHNPIAAESCINNLVCKTNESFIRWVRWKTTEKFTQTVWIAPDEGASKKIEKLAQKLEYTGHILTCRKRRDLQTGQITETQVIDIKDFVKEVKKKNIPLYRFLIIDDICDGGRTFIEIAKVLAKQPFNNTVKIDLAVTHGIFSAGFKELTSYFDRIYCTNSVKSVGDVAGNEMQKTRTIQYNVFR